jgi:hypothetical protein
MMPSSPSTSLTFAQQIIDYYFHLRSPDLQALQVEVMNPYNRLQVQEVVQQFYTKFFSDTHPRIFVIGINPGRFGGGITGIPFTDPVALREYCGIGNTLQSKMELSSRFVYKFINHFGGATAFYSRFFLTALFPLALTKAGKNYNFYDAPDLFATLKPAIVANIQTQLAFGANKNIALCLGKKNGEYLHKLNEENRFFDSITILEHPRYIMQYKLKKLDYYLESYLKVFQSL